MANPEHVKLVQQGAIARRPERYFGKRLDLSGADLRGVNFAGVDFRNADLFWANLSGADFTLADLSGADFTLADLSMANLSKAELYAATLHRTNLSRANLSEAELGGAKCGYSVFADCNLHLAWGLQSVLHFGPSSISLDTLMASFRGSGNRLTPDLETFFLRAGVPKEFLAELPRIAAEVRYCSAFICYGEPDRAFAEKLVNELRARGVSCWIYALDATPGERTWHEIGEKRREADKMVVLCSHRALTRDGVLKEIEEQIDEEPDKMVPVSLDDDWKALGFRVMRGIPGRDLKPFLLERNYADFSDPAKYEESLQRLLKGLERKQS